MKTQTFTTLDQWLAWIATIHPKTIALGLDRVKAVAERMGYSHPSCPVIIVGGTNGKGSCVATLEKIYSEKGYQTGVFTSPILFRHTEMLRINGQEIAESYFCEAYEKIENARQEITLTAFEFHTLAVLDILQRHALDVWILEVGLGGRLDAVNIVDADVAVVTSIGIDHVEWLGDTREKIGREKAGIFRSHQPAICGDREPPQSLREYADSIAAPFYLQGHDFYFSQENQTWSWRGKNKAYADLPFSQLAPQNISTALMAIEMLQDRLPVSEDAIRRGIQNVTLPGRIEIHPGSVTHIYDVGHNPAAVQFLAERLQKMPRRGKTRALFSMLRDKDIAGSLRAIKNHIDEWHIAPLTTPRAAELEYLRAAFQQENISATQFYPSIRHAKQAVENQALAEDLILIFGSFHTVAEAKSE